MTKTRKALFLLLAGLCFSTNAQTDTGRAETLQPIYGAGPSTQIVTLFFAEFSKLPEADGYSFQVPQRSTKHAGGIRASGEHLFGRTGRPLNEQEKQQDKFEIILGRVPIGFVTGGKVRLQSMAFGDIDAIFSGQIENWKEFQGPDAPVVLIGREPTEAVLSALSPYFPSLKQAKFQHILKRDHAVANLLRSPAGHYAIGFGALSNFQGLNIIELQGPALGVGVGLVVDNRNRNHPLVKAVERYGLSPEWRRHVEKAGYFAAGRSD